MTKQELDVLQIEFECCGSVSFTDWFKVPWIHEEYVPKSRKSEGPYYNDDVPFSCCSPDSPRPCVHHHVMDNTLHYNYDYRSSLTIYRVGCRDKLTEHYGQEMLVKVGAIVVSISILQITIVVLTRLLQTSIQAVVDADDHPLSPGDACIFPWGKTALRAVKKEIKKYHKKDRGEENEELDNPLMSEKENDSGSDSDIFDSDFDSIGEEDGDSTGEPIGDITENLHSSQNDLLQREYNSYGAPEDVRVPSRNNLDERLVSDVIYENTPQRIDSMRDSTSRVHPSNVYQYDPQREFHTSGNVSSIHTALSISPSVQQDEVARRRSISLRGASGYVNDGAHNYGSLHSVVPPALPERPRQPSVHTASRYVNDLNRTYPVSGHADHGLPGVFPPSKTSFSPLPPPISNEELSRRIPARRSLNYVNNYNSTIPPAPTIPRDEMYNKQLGSQGSALNTGDYASHVASLRQSTSGFSPRYTSATRHGSGYNSGTSMGLPPLAQTPPLQVPPAPPIPTPLTIPSNIGSPVPPPPPIPR